MKDIFGQYIARYAEKEAQQLHRILCEQKTLFSIAYKAVIIIPARQEPPFLYRVMQKVGPAASGGKYLVVVVANETAVHIEDKPLDEAEHSQTTVCSQFLLASEYECTAMGSNSFLCRGTGWDVLLIDRESPGRELPSGQGVGLARKIGCDVAAVCIHHKIVVCPWLYNTDADAVLPSDYFVPLATGCAAAVFPYEHVGAAQDPVTQAHTLYEIWLRYYVEGLYRAGSAYAFSTIGSTIAVSFLAYLQVRGVPKRLAGEDFHLLNKLAKVGQIFRVDSGAIALACRRSSRALFGTGKRTADIVQSEDPLRSTMFYHPKVFSLLRSLLQDLSQVARGGAFCLQREWYPGICRIGLDASLRSLWETSSPSNILRRFHEKFDGLQTLRFLRTLQREYPLVTWDKAVEHFGYDPEQGPEQVCDSMKNMSRRFGKFAGVPVL